MKKIKLWQGSLLLETAQGANGKHQIRGKNVNYANNKSLITNQFALHITPITGDTS